MYIFKKYVKGVGSPGGSVGKESACNTGDEDRFKFDPQDPRVREDALEEGMATHSSILAWESHGQRSLAGYSPWGHKGSDTT